MNTDKKNETIKSMMEVEYYPDVPPELIEELVDKKDSIKFPLEKLNILGVAFASMPESIRTIATSSTQAVDGLFRMSFPEGVSGHLAKFKDGSGFIGSIVNEHGLAGQARWNPATDAVTKNTSIVPYDPTMLFMAAALMQIEKKLDTIQETQTKILEFLEEQKKAEMTGNLKYLSEIMTDYKFNYNNDKFINAMLVKVQDVKQSSEQDMNFYCSRMKKLFLKNSFFVEDKELKNKLDEIYSQFKNYRLAMYLYAFSSFLHVLLLKNFDENHLDYISDKLKTASLQYRELYTDCYNKIEKLSSSTIQSRFLSGLSGVNKIAGDAISKVPLIEKSPLDEGLLAASSKLEEINSNKTGQILNRFISCRDSYIYPFIENIDRINELHNCPMQICFDKENIYYLPERK